MNTFINILIGLVMSAVMDKPAPETKDAQPDRTETSVKVEQDTIQNQNTYRC